MADHKVIFWNTAKSGWSVLWLDKKTKKIHMKSISSSMPKIICPECKTNLTGNITCHYRRVHPGKEYTSERLKPTITPPDTEKNKKAKQELEKFISEIPDDNTLDISVKEYINMTPTARSRFSGFIGQCVQWEEKPVDIDPYVLGLWLGDGYQTGYGFVVNWEKDPEILDYLNKWGENNDMIFRKLKRPIEFHIDGTKRKAPFKALLQKYNLVKNKHIPKDYLVNSRKNRLALLAGIIDTDGTGQSDGTRIVITQGLNHTQLAKDIVFLAKSLGFTCSTHIMKTQWTHKGELRRGTAINMNISGAGVEDIPTRLPRKKCVAPSKKDVSNTGSLKIRQVEDADFVGFQVDGNNRFLLEDFTVTHNCNIFSKTFTVEGADPDNKKLFRQTWTNNMRNPSEPVISPYKEKKGYTKVFYTLDFARFGVEGYTDDIISLYKRLAVDASMVTKVPLFWNGEEIPVHSLVDYAKLFSGDEAETLFIKTKDCEVVISSSSEGESQTISFANGIYTPSGGTHVEAWSEVIFRPLIDKLNKPKKPQVNIGDVKKFFRLFVVATVKNPEFDSQSKFKLEAPQITAEVKKSHIATISRWTVMDRLEDIIRAKEMVVLKKAERKKRGYEKVEGLEPANNEGGSKSTECTLILVEGLSAKTYASWGIQRGAFGKKGRDWFGIFPLRGKVLNCRNAKPVTISKNKIVTDIIKALGIQYDLDYSIEENYKKLRYGRVMIICDADVDGHHISGLIQNMFHALFPTLLKRQVPFLTSMQTPIVRVYLGKTDKLFYDEQEYRKYVKTLDGKKINKKYYKGLGSSNEDDVAETFGQKLIEYKEDEHTFENMNKAFNTKFSDMRKEWLEHYDSSQTVLKWDGNKEEKLAITFSDYINTELIKFSLDDCKRSIPNIMDGLKEGHRKVLYVCFLNNIKHTGKTIKVAQLAGMVSHKAGYHHGEQNLEATMTHMANAYVGSNNIPLLFRDGQFGCLDPDTPVLAFDGSIKLAKDVRVGDLLIGDDGSKRTVTGLFSGEDNMYKVTQSYGDNYIVNSSHILTLRYSGNRCIYWKESSNCWYMEYYSTEHKQIKYRTESVSLSVSKEDAYEKMFKLRETLPDTDIFDIKLGDYLKLAPSIKRKFKAAMNRIPIKWEKQDVPIDPYIFGMWLGDGNHDGCGFASADSELVKKWVEWADTIGAEVCHYTNGVNHENYHFGIRRRGSGFHTPIGSPGHNSQTCIGCSTSKKKFPVCDWVLTNKTNTEYVSYGISGQGAERLDLNPFKEILKKYNLYKNKHIPSVYLKNDEDTRLRLLAGLIDTDGCMKSSDNNIYSFEITQSEEKHGNIIHSVAYIARSLGFRASVSRCKGMISVFISGDGIEKIPTVLYRKKLPDTNKRTREWAHCNISIEPVGYGKFNGWSLDGNCRFLLGDFTVTHNSRAENGDDAAAGRYIWTKLDAMTRYIFREEDDMLLDYIEDDGDKVEPKFYVPIIPMILINGMTGIGTGWSSSIPSYNPLDIISAIKVWINNGHKAFDVTDDISISLLPELTPWYRGHTGDMTSEGDGKYTTWGRVDLDNKGKAHVSELPVGMSTSSFVDFLEEMKENKHISNYKNHSTPKDISFTITESSEGISCDVNNLKLFRHIRTTNMVAFTENGAIKKFNSAEEIIDSFCQVRYLYYVKRKERILKNLDRTIKILGNKKRFLQEVRDGIFKLFEDVKGKRQSRKTVDIIKELEQTGYDRDTDGEETEEEDGDENRKGYEYLLRLQISSITAEKIDKLHNDIASNISEREELKATSEDKLWIRDLEEFENEYVKWLPVINNEKQKKKR
jgi:DNA gyrase/topoisomerase IV subunit B